MFLFDIAFYLIARFYAGFKEKSSASTAAAVVGGLQTMNIFTLIMLVSVIFEDKRFFQRIFILVVIILFFQIVTYIRYLRKGSKLILEVEEKWLKKNESQKTRIRLFVAIYIAASVVSFFGLAIYLGRHFN